MKTCSCCGDRKGLTEFHKHKNNKDGLNKQCKTCAKMSSQRYRESNREKLKLDSRLYRAKYADRVRTAREDPRRKFSILATSAKKRGYSVFLSFSEYCSIISVGKCFYCSDDISRQGGGCLNRVDNLKGYFKENVKPCCTTCNTIMMDFTKEELLDKLPKILQSLQK